MPFVGDHSAADHCHFQLFHVPSPFAAPILLHFLVSFRTLFFIAVLLHFHSLFFYCVSLHFLK